MKAPIPSEALDDRLGFVGTAGSGKTYNAGSGVERLLDIGARVIIPDPLGVWWGLRLKADGKTPSGHDVVIFGGPHGDLPITENSGALIGQACATMAESAIIDLSELGTKAAERRFMLAFLTVLYRDTAKTPTHLIFDEADMWAPQHLLDREAEAAKLLGMMETVVRRGRVKGFIPWLITQRPAVLSKNVLSQVDGLVGFKLTAMQDRGALGAWVEGQADKGQWKAIHDQLPTLERGQGVVWIPARGILTTARFPLKKTFDSSRTPKRGEVVAEAVLQPLDLGALRDRLGTIEKETAENDPKALRRRIAELEIENLNAATTCNGDELAAEYKRGWDAGHEAGYRSGRRVGGMDATNLMRKEVDLILPEFTLRLQDAVTAAGIFADHLAERDPAPMTEPPVNGLTTITDISRARGLQDPRRVTEIRGGEVYLLKPPTIKGTVSDGLGRAERAILTACAQHPAGRTRVQAALLSGYSIKSSSFSNALGALRSKEYVYRGEPIKATAQGLAALGSFDPLPQGPALVAHWMQQLGKAERALLEVIVKAYPKAVSRDDLAQRSGYSDKSSSFTNALGRLRSLELINRGQEIKVADELMWRS